MPETRESESSPARPPNPQVSVKPDNHKTMTIDNTPAIQAFAEARIQQLTASPQTPENKSRIDECMMFVALCKGLLNQARMIEGAIKDFVCQTKP